MPTVPTGDPNTLVEQFLDARRGGDRLSIDRLLDSSDIRMNRDAVREEVVRILGRRLRSGTVAAAAGSSGQAGATPTALAPPPELPGYEIIDCIGRGGMGVVWEAYQTATGRRVAIKFLSETAGGADIARQRFEREVELLARLQHPHIVSVLDSGVHSSRYFYAMDYVEGRPLDEAFVPGKADVRQVLEVLTVIAETVDFAHQRGVLHRDLKPSNILLEEGETPKSRDVEKSKHDEATSNAQSATRNPKSPMVKVLDFGLAKAMDPARTGSSAYAASLSEPGQLLGTLAYMPPEQSRGRLAEISVRSDVYSLGAVAYELLTGRLPVSIDGPLGEVLARIASEDPPAPSAIRRDLSADIDAIVLKALQKSPDRRYATAADFAADLRRFLTNQPVLARPDTFLYRAGKFIRRNRLPVAFAATVFLGVSTLAVTMTIQSRRIAHERDAAELARIAEAEQRKTAQRNEATAKREAEKSDAVNQFLQDMLISVDPTRGGNKDVSVVEVLDQASGRLATGALRDQPEIEASIRFTLGQSYRALGRFPVAEENLRAALEGIRRLPDADPADVVTTTNELAAVLREQEKKSESERLFREALDAAAKLYGPVHKDVATLLDNLASSIEDQGRLAEAEGHRREALAVRRKLLGDEHGDVAIGLGNLAMGLQLQGKFAEAETAYQEALAIDRKAFGEEHPYVTIHLSNYAALLEAEGKLADAESLHRKVLALSRKQLGDIHPGTAESISRLAMVLRAEGKYSEAEPMAREALTIKQQVLGEDHLDIATSMLNLAAVLQFCEKASEAEQLYRKALARWQKAGTDTREHASCLIGFAMLLKNQGRADEADPAMRAGLEMMRRVLGDEHPDVALCMSNLALLREDQGRLEDAQELLQQALGLQRKLLGADHPALATTMSNLAGVLAKRGDHAAAKGMYQDALKLQQAAYGDDHPNLATMLSRYSDALRLNSEFGAAETAARRALAIRIKRLPPSHKDIAASRCGLGGILIDLKNLPEAESMILGAWGSISGAAQIPRGLTQKTLLELVRLYETSDDADQAAQWRAKLAAWRATTQPASAPAASQPESPIGTRSR